MATRQSARRRPGPSVANAAARCSATLPVSDGIHVMGTIARGGKRGHARSRRVRRQNPTNPPSPDGPLAKICSGRMRPQFPEKNTKPQCFWIRSSFYPLRAAARPRLACRRRHILTAEKTTHNATVQNQHAQKFHSSAGETPPRTPPTTTVYHPLRSRTRDTTQGKKRVSYHARILRLDKNLKIYDIIPRTRAGQPAGTICLPPTRHGDALGGNIPESFKNAECPAKEVRSWHV